MWGICMFDSLHIRCRRFTPTHVGHIMSRREANNTLSVHPHACGAYVCQPAIIECLAWFTPTHVGHIIWLNVVMLCMTVHPHACGAYVFYSLRIIFSITVHPHACGAYTRKIGFLMRFLTSKILLCILLIKYIFFFPIILSC